MAQATSIRDRVRIKQVEVLSDNWYVLRKTTYDYLGGNGQWRELTRETYDRGNGATILLYSKAKQTVVLTRQFRFPAFVNGHDDLLIETCAGLLDDDDPHTCIRKETQEETGYMIQDVRKVFEAFMSPGSEYFDEDKQHEGGGLEEEGEEIEVLEMPLDQALGMIETGEICDGKTIMLLQYAKLHRLLD
jgi:nudix-type nucleoside diphosphatase (YffH/AdpP family)